MSTARQDQQERYAELLEYSNRFEKLSEHRLIMYALRWMMGYLYDGKLDVKSIALMNELEERTDNQEEEEYP